jgi:hypothetical protein
MSDDKGPSKVSKVTDETQEEDDDDEDDDEYEDKHGSTVVATLCRKVNPRATEKKLVIAVVVSSGGDRHDAQKCAKAHIEKLKGENDTLTCNMITGFNNNPKTQGKKKGEDEDEEEDLKEHKKKEDEDDEANEDDDDAEKDNQVDYTPKQFLGDVYNKGSIKIGYPLGGGANTHKKNEVTKLLTSNYEELLKDKTNDDKFKSTWLVLDEKTGVNANSLEYYNNTKNKVVVVVLSKRFFYPNSGSSNGGRTTPDMPILVCNVPYGNEKEIHNDRYDGIFNQIGAFLTRYNSKEYANKDKIDLIAISYPKSLLDSMKKTKIKKPAPSKSKSKGTKAAKKNGPKGKGKNTDKNENKGEDEDEDEDDTEGEGSGDEEGQEDDETEDIEDSEEPQDIWLRALDKWLGNEYFDNIPMKLMYEENDEVWGAPEEVKEYFSGKRDGLLKKFPHCINRGKSAEERTVNVEDLKTTMFVCDLEPGKRVGNSNSHESTGGVFGSWVPMHYTAAYIDKQQAVKYTKASAGKIASLIEVIEVTKDGSLHQSTDDSGPTQAATNETNIDTSNLKEIESERRKLVGTMNTIYNTGFGPPAWVGDIYVAKETFDRYAPKARLFYDEGAKVEEVKKVAMEREPVNMVVSGVAMKRQFDTKKMKGVFGYDTSYYQRYYTDNQKLAPNIGVLTRSQIKLDSEKLTTEMYIYHAIGAALDIHTQPDYDTFVTNKEPDVSGLVRFYVSVFVKMFEAASMLKGENMIDGIVMSLVGAGAFASQYPNGNEHGMQRDVWIPAFDFARKQSNYKDINIVLACKDDETGPAIDHMKENVKANVVGLFPGFLKEGTYDKWMIVNAWDCHTIPGNGNGRDNTLDGYIGRRSAIHYFGWGLSNPHLLKADSMIKVSIPKYDKKKKQSSKPT